MNFSRALLVSAASALGTLSLIGCQAASDAPHPGHLNDEAAAIPAADVQRGPTLVELTGEDLGIGGGFLIAAAPDKVKAKARDQALAAAHKAEESPAQLHDVDNAPTADLNHDGFVTLDEVLAMTRAGLNDNDVIDRLRKTGYIFQLTVQQEHYLLDRNAPQKVVSALRELVSPKPGGK